MRCTCFSKVVLLHRCNTEHVHVRLPLERREPQQEQNY